ncbi:hypothetical protein CHPC595_0027 [Streptococcus phage CHPC595]|uniref:Uncharacterized protein n=3 Tax=Moineauvirus TaxID=1623304 RepID=A0A3G8FCV8_9CAUD|nr:hypothetical protein PP200_gp23 [Streptococcus phage CHPC1045]YP_010645721.1 hypothetical protein PP208_gp26 [Streptococcus phage CHPC595]YP_010647584.1 hypothetical protein PP248_gp23 [Streptococcus phage P9901]ARU14716.1 hypothetical protein P9901_23 [Streptococcus phage P9901]AZF92316.1 hypothetical protein CHPC595_0027 [Streptococcus phage CHPC595]AZF92634.1 hypothetical protein CHPC1045_0024 [Streptococcus phage CHPC1045]
MKQTKNFPQNVAARMRGKPLTYLYYTIVTIFRQIKKAPA